MGFCPACRSEYVAGIETCSECEQPLVDTLPPEEDLQPVYAATDPLEADLVRETLLAAEIEAAVINYGDRMFPAGATVSAFTVAVFGQDLEAARELLAEAMEQETFGGKGKLL